MNLVILYLFNLFWSISIKLFIELALLWWCSYKNYVNINNKLNLLCNYLHSGFVLCKFLYKYIRKKYEEETEVNVFKVM